jgi:hypothetical protein
MPTFAARLAKAFACTGCIAAAMLPLAAHANEVTFDWVPSSENPPVTSMGSGSITIDLSSWTLTNPSGPPNPNFGPYYTSASAITGTITAFSYTAADGQTADLADLSTTTIGAPGPGNTQVATIWATTAIDTPGITLQSPSAGYYLVTPFSVSGDTAGGTPFMIANGNSLQNAGATFTNGIPNGDVTFNADGSIPATEDGGYWEVAPVPLPPALPMLLGGLALLGWTARRRAAGTSPSPSLAM